MIQEIYCRIPSDIQYKLQIECKNELEAILQRIRVILGTKPGQVLGDYSFGIDLDQYIFQYGIPTDNIKNTLTNLIVKYAQIDTDKYNISVDVNFGQDHYNKSDYAVIDIIINQIKLMGVIVT